jgi:sulfonate transport system ATP-binding protein
MNGDAKVKISHMTKSFGELLVLDDVSFEVRDREFLCIVGPTGCGKTTFLNTLTKIYEPTSGDILINGRPIDLKRNSIAYIMQEYSCMPWLNVEENVAYGLKIRGIQADVIRKKVNWAINIVGLAEFRKYYPHALSASMMQRVSIARAFAVDPELLLMDEPYGQLDIDLRFRLEDELLDLWRKNHITVIFITHNIEEAVYLGERILVLTNKPTMLKTEIRNELSYPRDITSQEFIKLRNIVTQLIKWW